MIEVRFNSKKIDWDLKDTNELPAALLRIEKEYLPDGNFIRDVLLDGVSLVANGDLNLDSISAEQKVGAHSLNIISCTMMQLTQDAVRGAQDYLSQLSAPVSQVAKQFSTGQFDKAPRNLVILMDGFSSLISLLASLESSFPLEFKQIRITGLSIHEHLQNFRKMVKELLCAQERSDNITLADILEYELRPQLQIWADILKVLGQTVQEKA